MHTVENASEKIQSVIKGVKMPQDIADDVLKNFDKLGAEFVAVRSSATAEDSADAAWAGQLDSYLNTKRENVLKRVQDCWASLFTPRAIFYRFEKYGDKTHLQKISVAVVVQKMVNSEKSGIAFSVHPVTEDYNQIIIEAGFGLGEAVVSGQITPDSYVVEKEPRRIIDINVAEQERGLFRKAGGENEWKDLGEKGKEQVLSGKDVMELTELIIKIENHYGFPCDIEWAWKNGKFYIVQSRPITTLQKKEADEEKMVWVKNASGKKIGYQVIVPFLDLGIPYIQETLFGELSKYIKNAFYYMWGVDNEGMYYLENELNDLVAAVLELIYADPQKIEKTHREAYKLNDEFFQLALKLEKIDFAKFSDKELAELHKDFTILQEKAHIQSTLSTWFVDSTGGLFATRLLKETEEIIKGRGQELNPAEVFTTLTTPEKDSFGLKEELESSKKLKLITGNKKARDIFKNLTDYKEIPTALQEDIKDAIVSHYKKWRWTPFGYMGPAYDLDFYLSIWSGLIKQDFDVDHEMLKITERVKHVKKEKEEVVKKLKIPKEKLRIFDLAADITFLKGYRKDCSYKGFYAFSFMAREIAKRLDIEVIDVYLLTHKEIYELLTENKTVDLSVISKRRKAGSLILKGDKLTVISGDGAEEFFNSQNIKKEEMITEGNNFKGNCASAGKAKGIVKIVNDPAEMGKMEKGDIMVSHTTFPSLVPAMKKAAAIVTEDGGITCHAAIVARELKTPCVTGIKNITEVVKDGDLVEVDADKGVVRIIKN